MYLSKVTSKAQLFIKNSYLRFKSLQTKGKLCLKELAHVGRISANSLPVISFSMLTRVLFFLRTKLK